MRRFVVEVPVVVPALIVCGGVVAGIVLLYWWTQRLGVAVVGSIVGTAVFLATAKFLKNLFDGSGLKKIRRTGIVGAWANWLELERDSGISIYDRIKNAKNSIYFVGTDLKYTASEFREPLKSAILNDVTVRLLLLDPDSKYAEAQDEVEPGSFRTRARDSIAVFEELRSELPPEARNRLLILKSKQLPHVSIKIFDEKIMLLNLYLYGNPARRNPIFEVHNTGEFYSVIRHSVDIMAQEAGADGG